MLLLFDIDGTICLSGGAGRRALTRAFEELFGLGDAMAEVRLHGNTDPVIVQTVFDAKLGRPAEPEEHDRLIDRYLEFLEIELERTRKDYQVMPGVEETLARAAGRCAVGLATGNVERGARLKLSIADLWRHFKFGGYGSDAGDRTELVRRGVERGQAWAERSMGRRFDSSEIFVLGDTERDVQAAKAAGVRSIGVLAGSSHQDELRSAEPDLIADTLADEALWRLIGLA